MSEQTSLQRLVDAKLVSIATQREEALWIIAYGIEKFYITNDEKVAFLDAISKGAKWLDIRGNILTDKFLYIVLDDGMYEALKEKNSPHKDPFGKPYYMEEKEITPEEREKIKKAIERTRKILKERGVGK